MTGEKFFDRTGRKVIITGHYGSGKTEFAISLAMLLAAADSGIHGKPGIPGKLAIVDLDIVNPYFRSRERRDMLEEAGISVFGSVFDREVTAELPALGASVRAPLEDKDCRVIIDAGGNDSGALVLNQFAKYFKDDTTVLAAVNANRPDTSDPGGASKHISAIEAATGLTVDGIVNNCHLLRETTADAIIKGHTLCAAVSESTGKPLWCDCYPAGIVDPADLQGLSGYLMPLGMYMRPTWLDK